jgi:hypothetical protein
MFHRTTLFLAILPFVLLCFAPAASAATVVQPITMGPYPVGSTNFEVRSLSNNAEMEKYLIGAYSTSGEQYIADRLVHPGDCPSIDVPMPVNASLFGRHAGKTIHFVAYILYPTTDNNTRPNYSFPYTNTGDSQFPHMQRMGEAPILRDPRARYPLIVYSHGYTAHGLWDLGHMKFLASQGYIVVALQHGDGRNSFQGCLGERPVAISRILDYVLAHPVFGPAIDTARIGMTGTSLGGYTTLAVVGGGCNFSPLVPPDKRFRAAFGLVPLVGGNYGVAPFGGTYASLKEVTCPFFAVYAQNDTSVPKTTVEGALPKLGGTCTGVMFPGETHSLSNASYEEAQTYETLFFNAWLRDDSEAMKALYSDMTVAGGPSDRRTYQKIVPAATIDEDAAFGGCPAGHRLNVRIVGNKIRVVFPISTNASPRYDLMGTANLHDWQCLRTTEVTPLVQDLPAYSLPNGFRWRAVEVQGAAGDLTEPLFMQVRLSE